ncbi:hypothetical protein Pflav_014490 [Phytohabitans flavus]|uniref:PLL-like beta propeller domain-containing protein n=1 Tax=Phytohabitans flavus TaxID=1076124 RepID=A0A6F8XMM3_9ACTN|nr:tectonin domain-containing protein [Phytohabitans flavus]BCB75039.1 hypothetical protein Pflav_014490 [Phytohabitans flavus]
MLTKRRSLARRLMAAWLAAAVSVGVSVAAPAPARADVLDDLLNEAAGFAPFFGYLKRGLDFYDNHLAGRPAVVSLQAEIRKARGEILAEIGDIAAADVSACASNTVHTFENLHLLSPDNKQAFADSSAECLFRARELIAALGPDSKAAVDELGFALNAVGPLTLVANLEAGFTTETLRQTLISGNAELLVKLRPTCAVRSLSFTPGSPEVDGKVIMQGPWKCVPYHATLADPGGTLPFPVYAATHAGLFSILDPDRWPAAQDLSIAANQAMATTSYMLAKAALDKLRPATTGRLGSPIAAATSTSATGPVKLFQARADGATQHTRRSSPTQFIGFRTFEGISQFATIKAVASASHQDGRVELFAIDRLGDIHHRWQGRPNDDASWSDLAQMDGNLNTIAMARNLGGAMQIFGTNRIGQVWTRWQTRGTEQTPMARNLAAGRDIDSRPVQAGALTINNWSPWQQIPGGTMTNVAAATTRDGRIELFAVDTAGVLHRTRQTGPDANGGWRPWEPMGGVLTALAAATNARGEIELFGITASGDVQTRKQTSANSEVYGGWMSLGDLVWAWRPPSTRPATSTCSASPTTAR